MDKFVIRGGAPLRGEIPTSGAKNSALPALAACLLTEEPVILHRIPRVRDILTMAHLLRSTGVRMEMKAGPLRVEARDITTPEAPYELVKTMRASSLVLGPLLARTGRARVSLPGGCAIGARPINFHLSGLEQLGAEIRQEHGYVEAVARQGLRGALGHLRPDQRHRHRGPHDGGGAGQRGDGNPERGARARSDRPGRIAHQDGRADRRRGRLYDPHRGRGAAARAPSTRSFRTASRPARS